ncbi:MAG: aldo/keto reductase [Planctomycetaceae bacterium]|nr:MAG: aldo/keto reductase [Planctomycetaceae bacterium]
MPFALPRLIFGATTLGNLFVAPPDSQKRELIRRWFQLGPWPVAIDSAGKYGAGLSLEVIGRELAALQIDPSEVILSNKLGWRRVPLTTPEPTFEPGAWVDVRHDAVQDISREGILRCWSEGDELLAPYHADLLSVHDPDEYLAAASDPDDRRRRLDDIISAYQAIRELRDAGRVAAIGVGAKDWTIIRELDQHCDFDWVMLANSFTIMRHPPELIAFIASLASRDVWVINSALMHGGFLTGGDHCDYRRLDPGSPADQAKLVWRERFHQACRELAVDPFHVAVAFGGSSTGIRSVALSTSRPERVESLVAAAHNPVPPEVWTQLHRRGLIAVIPSPPASD